MNSATLKAQIRAVVFGLFGIIIAIVLVRILLKFVGANPDASFVNFWYDMSNYLVGMFRGIYPTLQANLLKINIELFSVMSLLFYAVVAFLVQKSFTSFAEGDPVEVIKHIIDAIFKIVEFLLISRFFFKVTAASAVAPFTKFIYSISAIVYEPFQGILPTVRIGEFGIIFESSTLIAIVVIIIFDIVTEGIIDNLTGNKNKYGTTGINYNNPPQPVVQQPVPQPIYQQPAQQPQNITINVPQQQQQPPQVIDRRTVQVITPNPQASYPGQNQSHLEGQRPQTLQQLPGRYQHPSYPGNNNRFPNSGQGNS